MKEAIEIIEALGGIGNIKDVDSCLTRLRVSVARAEDVNISKLKEFGALGVLQVGEDGIQAIYGDKASYYKKIIEAEIQRRKYLTEEEALEDKGREIIEALGGIDNIKDVDACLTRLRLIVRNPDVVDISKLKDLGAIGVVKVGEKGIQAIFGDKSSQYQKVITAIINSL